MDRFYVDDDEGDQWRAQQEQEEREWQELAYSAVVGDKAAREAAITPEERARREEDAANAYADAMVKRDIERAHNPPQGYEYSTDGRILRRR